MLYSFLQASLSLTTAAAGSSHSHPSLIVKEKLRDEVQIFLVCEQSIITEVSWLEAPIILLSAYYSFNMQSLKGLQSFCTLLEILLCGLKPHKVPNIVSNILIGLKWLVLFTFCAFVALWLAVPHAFIAYCCVVYWISINVNSTCCSCKLERSVINTHVHVWL